MVIAAFSVRRSILLPRAFLLAYLIPPCFWATLKLRISSRRTSQNPKLRRNVVLLGRLWACRQASTKMLCEVLTRGGEAEWEKRVDDLPLSNFL